MLIYFYLLLLLWQCIPLPGQTGVPLSQAHMQTVLEMKQYALLRHTNPA